VKNKKMRIVMGMVGIIGPLTKLVAEAFVLVLAITKFAETVTTFTKTIRVYKKKQEKYLSKSNKPENNKRSRSNKRLSVFSVFSKKRKRPIRVQLDVRNNFLSSHNYWD